MGRSARRHALAQVDQFEPDRALEQFPWLLSRDQDCILSPDADGLLCGLLMSHYLGWRIQGFYDTKVLVHKADIRPSNCVFLDVEIFRREARSVGQHMLIYNRRRPPANWQQFQGIYSINEFRGREGCNDFSMKYPFGTIHFILATIADRIGVEWKPEAVAPLLFVDGTYPNVFNYTENCLDWIRYLAAGRQNDFLSHLFSSRELSIRDMMRQMAEFWKQRDTFSIRGERGDRVAITIRGGNQAPHNLVAIGGRYSFDPEAKQRAVGFLELLASCTGWRYHAGQWTWEDWQLAVFEKRDLENATIPKFDEMFSQNPLSLAMSAPRKYYYTIDRDNLFR